MQINSSQSSGFGTYRPAETVERESRYDQQLRERKGSQWKPVEDEPFIEDSTQDNESRDRDQVQQANQFSSQVKLVTVQDVWDIFTFKPFFDENSPFTKVSVAISTTGAQQAYEAQAALSAESENTNTNLATYTTITTSTSTSGSGTTTGSTGGTGGGSTGGSTGETGGTSGGGSDTGGTTTPGKKATAPGQNK